MSSTPPPPGRPGRALGTLLVGRRVVSPSGAICSRVIRLGIILLCAILLGSSLVACGEPEAEGEITVFAAASLTEVFRSLAEAYRGEGGEAGEAREILLNLAGSQVLAAQILAGAPAHVFASADEAQMRRVDDAGLVEWGPVTFAENDLAIVVEAGNPHRICSLSDLARPDLAVVLGAPGVPVGEYSRRALEAAGVDVRPVSLEMDVKQVVAKVSLGEADAGIVYETDVLAAGDAVEAISLSGAASRIARYEIALLETAGGLESAETFLGFLRSPRGEEILREHGFRIPVDG